MHLLKTAKGKLTPRRKKSKHYFRLYFATQCACRAAGFPISAGNSR